MKGIQFVIPFSVVMLLAGCAAPGPRELPPVEDSLPPVDQPLEPQTPADQPPVSETPPTTSAPAPVNPAVTSLINQARAQYNARNYQVAIATAERGLRIDRRTPELYLIMAQSYLQMAMPQQAEQFVQQGLRFAQSGSAVADSLLRVREILVGSDL